MSNDKNNRNKSFVEYIINLSQNDKGAAAALRRADNPNLEYQCWEYLARFNIALDKSHQRLPFATIAAAIAKSKAKQNGSVGIGYAISCCYKERNNSNQAKAKLRRLLACESIEEICRILRPIFSIINAKAGIQINFIKILNELLKFKYDPQYVKSIWAQEFYGNHAKIGENE